jgi:hypothetical protein
MEGWRMQVSTVMYNCVRKGILFLCVCMLKQDICVYVLLHVCGLAFVCGFGESDRHKECKWIGVECK